MPSPVAVGTGRLMTSIDNAEHLQTSGSYNVMYMLKRRFNELPSPLKY